MILTGAEPGKYQRFMITVKGDELTVHLNGKEVQNLKLPATAPTRSALGLRDTGNALEFMNLYARDL